ncbi:unnamed protein product [Malus baccata var. baccata]
MVGEEGASGLKLEGGAYCSTHGSAVNPVVIQSDASAVPRSVKEPKENNAEYEAWEMGNTIVKRWLINSMDPTIMGFFIHLRTAKEVWDEVARTYYDGSDISQIYELKVKSFRLRQEGRLIGVYYADLKAVWQELDQRRPIKMECAIDLKTLQEEIQLDRVYAFLAGLDDIFDKVRSDILRTQPLPSVEEVFSIVRREAQRHATMMGSSGVGNQGEAPHVAMSLKVSESETITRNFIM